MALDVENIKEDVWSIRDKLIALGGNLHNMTPQMQLRRIREVREQCEELIDKLEEGASK